MEKKQQQGFTIIEVVLVLAIAGLIFLMVFLALPALQRSQRDSTRRSSVSYFASQVAQYQANNRGAIPTAGTTCPAAGGTVVCFVNRYMQTNWVDPSSDAAYVRAASNNAVRSATVPGTWFYSPARICGVDGNVTAAGATARNFAITMRLESAGIHCVDNRN